MSYIWASVGQFIADQPRGGRVSAVRASPPWRDVLQMRQCLCGPAFEGRIVIALCISLEQRNGLLVTVKLHLIVVLTEIRTGFAA